MHIELYNDHMNYLELVKVMRNQRDIVVAFKELRFGTLIDGPANKKVSFCNKYFSTFNSSTITVVYVVVGVFNT